jgi:hypothetical protein
MIDWNPYYKEFYIIIFLGETLAGGSVNFNQYVHNRHMKRRQVIRSAIAGGGALISGCIESEESPGTSDTPTAGTKKTGPRTTVTVGASAPTGAPSRTQTATPTKTQKPTPQNKSPSTDGRVYTVAKDGSGDYKSVEKPLKIAREQDIIKFLPGEYEVTLPTPDVGGGFSDVSNIVGSGKDNTQVTFLKNSPRLDGTVSVYVSVFDMTVEAKGANNFEPPWEMYHCRTTTNWTGRMNQAHDVDFESELEFIKGSFKWCRFQDRINAAGAKFKRSTFKRSTFQGDVIAEGGGVSIIDSSIEGKLRTTDKNNRIEVVNSELNTSEMTGTGDIDLEQSVFDGRTTIASPGLDGAIGEIKRCTFKSPVVFQEGENLSVTNCRFETNEEKWAIDGIGPERLYHNAFLNCDLRVDNNIYVHSDNKGNYYSTFSKADEDEDGIIDTARLIPGSAEVVDQYPLASPDIDNSQSN